MRYLSLRFWEEMNPLLILSFNDFTIRIHRHSYNLYVSISFNDFTIHIHHHTYLIF